MNYLKVFTDFQEVLEPLTDEEVGRLFRAMLLYAEKKTETELPGNERFLWPVAKQNIALTLRSYENKVSGAAIAREKRSGNRQTKDGDREPGTPRNADSTRERKQRTLSTSDINGNQRESEMKAAECGYKQDRSELIPLDINHHQKQCALIPSDINGVQNEPALMRDDINGNQKASELISDEAERKNLISSQDKDKDKGKEQDKDKEKKDLSLPVGDGGSAACVTTADRMISRADVQRIISEWNRLGLSQVTTVTSDTKRGKMLRARVKEHGTEKVLETIRKIRDCPFLMGETKEHWTATFDWLICPENFLKVMEGNYLRLPARGRTPPVQREFDPDEIDRIVITKTEKKERFDR